MTDRYPLSDKQLYGAEDDADMDAVYRAMDKFEAESHADATEGETTEADSE